ncbi:MAG TPA: hypothetical protein PK490_12065, partial [Prosthecobacter sp.]|nr:hypothetical protein [Prosthecobacter sp.]
FKPRTLPPAPLVSNNNAPASGAPRQPRKTGVISAMARSQSWDSPAFEPLSFLMTDSPAAPPPRPAARRASLASIIHGGDAGAENDSALAPDDLTRIRGITPGIQQKLRSLGVRRYEHIASWTPQQVRDISRHLAFKDRIEREDWTGQARDLAAVR